MVRVQMLRYYWHAVACKARWDREIRCCWVGGRRMLTGEGISLGVWIRDVLWVALRVALYACML